MTARPIIFSGPMVRALIEVRKTQTRRLLKPQPPEQPPADCHPSHTPRHPAPYLDAYCGEPKTPENPRGMSRIWHWWQVDDRPGPAACKVPYAPGDRLWVKEACAQTTNVNGEVNWPGRPHLLPDPDWPHEAVIWRADGEWDWCDADGFSTERSFWRSSIHMPRRFSRLTLTVTDVRVQRLQEISEEDAVAEGATSRPGMYPNPDWSMDWSEIGKYSRHTGRALRQEDIALGSARWAFASYWNSIHGPDAWEANPWVVALTFIVEPRNIDAGGTA